MSKLLLFIVVLVSSALNSKTRCAKLPQCLLCWGSSCARSSCGSGEDERGVREVFWSLPGSVFHFQSRAVSQGRSVAVVWGLEDPADQSHPFSWQCVPGISQSSQPCSTTGWCILLFPKTCWGRKGAQWFYS